MLEFIPTQQKVSVPSLEPLGGGELQMRIPSTGLCGYFYLYVGGWDSNGGSTILLGIGLGVWRAQPIAIPGLMSILHASTSNVRGEEQVHCCRSHGGRASGSVEVFCPSQFPVAAAFALQCRGALFRPLRTHQCCSGLWETDETWVCACRHHVILCDC